MSGVGSTEPPRSGGAGFAGAGAGKRRRLIVAALGAAAAAAILLSLGRTRADAGATAAPIESTATVAVERRDLLAREDVDGTLGYADLRPVVATADGTVSALPAEGALLHAGEVLYAIGGAPTVLLAGDRPAWRRLAEGIAPGADVRQLERNLVALGFDPGRHVAVDERFDFATRAAVAALQRALGVQATGVLKAGTVVFQPAPRRVATVAKVAGVRVDAGDELFQTSAARRVVTVKLDVRKQHIVREGQRVEVELANGRIVAGTIFRVGRVAKAPPQGSRTTTIDVEIAPRGRVEALDQAAVTVRIRSLLKSDVLAVPVGALLAVEGGYALEVVRGAERVLVPIRTGALADGWVEVAGGEVGAGTVVTVAR